MVTEEKKKAVEAYLQYRDIYKNSRDAFFNGWNGGVMVGMFAIYGGRYFPWATDNKLPVWVLVLWFAYITYHIVIGYRDLKKKKLVMKNADKRWEEAE